MTEKTKKHMHGRPVTIPIHPQLMAMLEERRSPSQECATATCVQSPYINPTIAEMYLNRKRQLNEGLRRIFKEANITMSVRIEGRSRKTVMASFLSLRHTFVSLSANAGVPLPVVQSIVGHTSTAMTRHYYHENLDALRSAVASIPVIGEHNRSLRGFATHGEANTPSGASAEGTGNGNRASISRPTPHASAALAKSLSPAQRLKRLDKYFAQGLISEAEHAATRQRILNEM